jgi:hypothetical protein
MLLALFARASAAQADDAGLPLDLTWSAPDGCATADEIRTELGRIARVRPGRTVPRLLARGRIDRAGDSLRLTLRTEQNGHAGERTLVAKECRSLEREVTLVLAVAFGEGVEIVESSEPAPATEAPLAENAGTETKPGTSDATAPTSSSTPSTPPAPITPPKPPEPLPAKPVEPSRATETPSRTSPETAFHAAGFAGGGVVFRELPSPAAFVVVGGDFGTRRFWIEPRALWLPHVADTLGRGVRARYDGFGGALSGCAALPPFAWAFSACLGAEGTALRGRSTGASESGESFAPLWGAAATLAWQWPARGVVALRLEATLHVALDEPQFVVEGLGEVYRVPRLAPALAATVPLSP